MGGEMKQQFGSFAKRVRLEKDFFKWYIGPAKRVRSVKSTPFVQQLGLIFVTLKLVGVLAWPWIAVLAPFIVDIAMVAILGRILRRIQLALYDGPT